MKFNFFNKFETKKAIESVVDKMSPATIKLLILSGLLSTTIDSNAANPSVMSDLEIQNKSKETYIQNKNNEQLLLTYAKQLNTVKQHGDTTWKSFIDPNTNHKVTIEYVQNNPNEITLSKVVHYQSGKKCEIVVSDKIIKNTADGTNYFDGIVDNISIITENNLVKDISFPGKYVKEQGDEQRFAVIDNKTKKYLEGSNVVEEYKAANEHFTESLTDLSNSVSTMGETAQARQ